VAEGGFELLKGTTRVSRLLVGLAAMFVPISILKALSFVSFSGGRGLLLITDVDTVIMNLFTGACLYAFFKSRHRAAPVWVCLMVVALLTMLSMAYVVTNFGTLFRLRVLAIAPLCLLPALGVHNAEGDARPRDEDDR
jgi:hypothetical protein